ncbi:MAG: metal transporter [Chloroflexi bacterium]|nr:metal transporter [Chloroflexota bacterium]
MAARSHDGRGDDGQGHASDAPFPARPPDAAPTSDTAPAAPASGKSGGALALLALLPVALLVALISLFVVYGDELLGPAPVPPDALGKLDIERLWFRPEGVAVQVVNTGPAPLTVAQVIVNDALWEFAIEPGPAIPRLGRATIGIAYPWLEGEPVTVKVLTANGLAFLKTVPIAATTPEPSSSLLLLFALLGVLVGVLPVYLGLLWFPLVRRLDRAVLDFLLALTAGLLIFLGVDAVVEALELAGRVPSPFRGIGLVAIGVAGSILVLLGVSRRTIDAAAGRSEAERALALSFLISTGIGLHNFGEGLAIGAAYAVGELALGAFLVVGFTLHNITEGFGILTPIARHGTTLKNLLLLGLAAGGPTILGTWLGGFAYSDLWATLFLAIGAGAVFQVVYELARLTTSKGGSRIATPLGAAGVLTGMLLMYLTGLFVA